MSLVLLVMRLDGQKQNTAILERQDRTDLEITEALLLLLQSPQHSLRAQACDLSVCMCHQTRG